MSALEWVLELVLLGTLVATGFHAVRLERALRVLRGDRAALGDLVAGFDNSARTAGQGLEQLRSSAEGAGREIARHVERATTLRDDLAYLTERGSRLADRMDVLVRAGRASDGVGALGSDVADRMLSGDVERVDVSAPRRRGTDLPAAPPRPEPVAPLRSQAERDLLKALGVVR